MNLELLKSFFAIVDAGSINKAAERLNISQSTLTRQIQSLEQEIGTSILERSTRGVVPTATGQQLYSRMKPLLSSFESTYQEILAFARGQRTSLRIGYIASAASTFLNQSLSKLRIKHPDIKISLHDLSPGEQIRALRTNAIDIAMLGHAGKLVEQEFYTRRIASSPVYAALSETSRLAQNESLSLSELAEQSFVGAMDEDMPGINSWVTKLCRESGFKPRFLSDAESLTHGLSTIVSENATMIVPEHVINQFTPGVIFKRIVEPDMRWDFYVAWQRGKLAPSVKAFLEELKDS